MQKSVAKVLYSGHTFTNEEDHEKYKFIFLNIVISVISWVALVIGFVRISQENYLLGSLDMLFSVFSVVLLYFLRNSKVYIERVSTILLFMTYLLFMSIFIFAPEHTTRLSLFFILIPAVYFLKGKRVGLLCILVVVGSIGSIQFLDLRETNYTDFEVITLFLYFLITYFIMNMYETVKERQTVDLTNLNRDLEKLVDERTLELEREKDNFEKLSVTDQLTGLNNRHYLEKTFEYEKNQSRRYHTDVSVILIDLDNFKSVNDDYGHNIGDIFLKEFSDILKSSLRDTDSVGRWGGEEFLVVLPKADLIEAKEVAEKIRKIIQKSEFSHIGNRTASFGVATLLNEESLNDILNRADKALYKAKNSGRNRVEISI